MRLRLELHSRLCKNLLVGFTFASRVESWHTFENSTILGEFNNLLFGPEVAYIQCF